MGVEGQSHSPLGLVHISPPRPHRPMDACTHSSTNVQVARAQTRYHATLHTRATARGSQDATPAPLLGAHRARQRWCGERYRQTPGDHATNLVATMLVLLNGSAGLSSVEEPGTL